MAGDGNCLFQSLTVGAVNCLSRVSQLVILTVLLQSLTVGAVNSLFQSLTVGAVNSLFQSLTAGDINCSIAEPHGWCC